MAPDTVPAGVLPGQSQRVGGDVDGKQCYAGKPCGQGNRDTAAAGANINDMNAWFLISLALSGQDCVGFGLAEFDPSLADGHLPGARHDLKRGLNEQFRFRPGDEDVPVDLKLQAKKFLATHNVSHRFAPSAAIKQLIEHCQLFLANPFPGMDIEPGTLLSQGVGQQNFGIQRRGSAAGLGQPLPGFGQEFLHRDRFRHNGYTIASSCNFSSWSALVRASINSSISPLRIFSKR